MPKYWGKQIFSHGRFPEVGQKQKMERKKKREKERKRLSDGNNNGQAMHGAHRNAWRTQAAWANINPELSSNWWLVISNFWQEILVPAAPCSLKLQRVDFLSPFCHTLVQVQVEVETRVGFIITKKPPPPHGSFLIFLAFLTQSWLKLKLNFLRPSPQSTWVESKQVRGSYIDA